MEICCIDAEAKDRNGSSTPVQSVRDATGSHRSHTHPSPHFYPTPMKTKRLGVKKPISPSETKDLRAPSSHLSSKNRANRAKKGDCNTKRQNCTELTGHTNSGFALICPVDERTAAVSLAPRGKRKAPHAARLFLFPGPWSLVPVLLQAHHQPVQRRLRRPGQRFGQSGQRLVHYVQQVDESGLLGVDIEDAGENLFPVVRFHQSAHGVGLVGGVVVLQQLAQAQVRTV